MKIERGTKVVVTLPYTYVDGQVGYVENPAYDPNELHTIKLDNGTRVSLFDSEFTLYKEAPDSKVILREKIETKIEEFKESLPPNGERLVHEEEWEAYHIIQGLKLALDIINEPS